MFKKLVVPTRWQDKSIETVVNFTLPGIYLLKAKTFGLKGMIGGTHSWIVHVDSSDSHLVAEVTDLETLYVQGATKFKAMRNPKSNHELIVFLSNRNGGQLWFGSMPKIFYLGNMTRQSFIELIDSYPLANNTFHVLNTNCNTFSSWICYKLEIIPKNIGIGSKTKDRWTHQHK